jgi:3-keto-disaccharide hydrolase
MIGAVCRTVLWLTVACVACASAQTRAVADRPNTLTDAERAAGWWLLFDGRTLAGWRGLGYDSVPTAHWVVVDGTIKKIASGNVPRVPDGRPLNGGDLMTVGAFGDFELSWEWKVTRGANSGVKYNVSEELSMAQGGQMTPAAVARGIISPNHSALGFEYQMLDDDRHPDGQMATHRAGALYDLFAPNDKKHVRPAGEWNRSAVIFRSNHGEHWLNGEKIVEFDLGTARMDSALAASKYRSIPAFAERRKGHIVLQDHGDEVYFRSIKVREP